MECRICLTPDPGNHYKMNCCRACAAFFRRTLQMKHRYRCSQLKKCNVTQENRMACKYCRMKRCIEAGMRGNTEDPDDSLDFYLDHSLPEIECFSNTPSGSFVESFSPEPVLTNPGMFYKQYKRKIWEILSKEPTKSKLPFKLSLYQQGTLAYRKYSRKWPDSCKEKILSNNIVDAAEIVFMHHKAVVHVTEFCMEFSSFSQLPIDQKLLVQAHYIPRLMFQDRGRATIEHLGNNTEDNKNLLYNGQIADCTRVRADVSKVSDNKEEEAINRIFIEEFDLSLKVMTQYKKLNPDQFELIYMILASLWSVKDIPGISPETLKIAEEQQEILLGELTHYYKLEKKLDNYAPRIYKMENLSAFIDKVVGALKEDSHVVKMFDLYNFEICIHDTISASH